MKKDIQIKVNTETNQVLINSEILGISSENLQGNIIFKPEPFINGTCRLYVEGLGVIEMDKQEDCYTLPIKSSLLKSPGIDICFKIIEPTNEEGTPIFATKIIHLKVLDTIEDDSEIPEQYPTWIETFDSKIAEIDDKLEEVDSAISNIQDLTSEYNQNAVNKTNDFNTNATNQTSTFDNHVTSKTEEFDADTDDIVGTKKAELDAYTNSLKNDLDTYESTKETELNTHTNSKKTELDTYEGTKETELNTYANGLKNDFNTNATNKTNAYNTNHTEKMTDYNNNTTSKVSDYNTNATTKTSEFNQNASDKTDDFDDNASAKTTAFNNNATAKTAEYDAHVSELQSQVNDLETLVETELDTNTVEGTEIDVSDSAEYKGKVEVKGNTEQEQLSGKNLFGISDYEKTYNGVQIKIKDGEITLNGTCTGTGTVYIGPKDEQILNGTYTISRNSISGTMSGSGNVNLRNVSDDSIISGTQMSLSINSRTFTLENANVEYGIYLMKDATFDNYKFRPQLVEGDTPDYDFEPYCGGQEAPNPSYEIPIKVVTGDNVVKHVGKNEFYGEDLGLWYNSSSNIFNTLSGFKSLACKVKPNTQYTISKKNASNRFVLITSEDKPRGSLPFTRLLIADNNRTNYTFTTLSNENYIFFGVYSGTNTEEIAQAIEEIQLEEGQNATTYEPYRKEEYKLDLWKENEFDINDVNKLNAYIDSSNKIASSEATRTLYVECKKNTLYKISKAKSARFRAMYTTDIPAINRVGNGYIVNDAGEEIIIKTGNNAKYLCVFYYHANQDTLTEQEILESIQIQEAIELCKIGDYSDILFKNVVGDENYNAELEDGAWYKKAVIKKVIFDGNEDWSLQSINSYGIANFNKSIVDYFSTLPNKSYTNLFSPQTSLISVTTKQGYYLNTNNTLYIRIDSSVASTVEQFKTWLSTHNLELYYVLLTPIYTQITDTTLKSQLEDLRKAKWFKGVNHFWTETENLEPVLKGTYKQSNNLRLQALENIILNQSTVQSVNTIASANISNKSVPTKQITEELEDTTTELENTTTEVSEESEVE